ncbi:hypothetical protein ONE63_006744 [Megalurothrips usitatus]|uniref:CD80-like immunoglobulin C2-set domain-containing protein n=1 Tax=Megalurothrips usitatus TaxID=439358 RepID=A0AAV7XTD2_9NEOP|nr:hypothetical protein ONE63_006744 [Megalurothrips usitatus]
MSLRDAPLLCTGESRGPPRTRSKRVGIQSTAGALQNTTRAEAGGAGRDPRARPSSAVPHPRRRRRRPRVAGRPEPTVTWFANGRLLEGVVDASTPKVIVSRLDVSRVTRDHLNTTYRCQASNTRLIDPKHHDVQLDLRLKPLSVHLFPRPHQLPADEEARFECVTRGSRPQAVVTWWKTRRGGQEEHHFGAPHVSTEGGRVSVSEGRRAALSRTDYEHVSRPRRRRPNLVQGGQVAW